MAEVGSEFGRVLMAMMMVSLPQRSLLIALVVVVDGISAHVVVATAPCPWQSRRPLRQPSIASMTVPTLPNIAVAAGLWVPRRTGIGVRSPTQCSSVVPLTLLLLLLMVMVVMMGRGCIPDPRQAAVAPAEHPKGHGACSTPEAGGGVCTSSP